MVPLPPLVSVMVYGPLMPLAPAESDAVIVPLPILVLANDAVPESAIVPVAPTLTVPVTLIVVLMVAPYEAAHASNPMAKFAIFLDILYDPPKRIPPPGV